MIKVVDHFFIVANYGWKYQSIVSFIFSFNLLVMNENDFLVI